MDLNSYCEFQLLAADVNNKGDEFEAFVAKCQTMRAICQDHSLTKKATKLANQHKTIKRRTQVIEWDLLVHLMTFMLNVICCVLNGFQVC